MEIALTVLYTSLAILVFAGLSVFLFWFFRRQFDPEREKKDAIRKKIKEEAQLKLKAELKRAEENLDKSIKKLQDELSKPGT